MPIVLCNAGPLISWRTVEGERVGQIEKEIRLAEWEIAQIRERYDVFSEESLHQAIQNGEVAGHQAWEDYIVWKNKDAHIARLRQMAERE